MTTFFTSCTHLDLTAPKTIKSSCPIKSYCGIQEPKASQSLLYSSHQKLQSSHFLSFSQALSHLCCLQTQASASFLSETGELPTRLTAGPCHHPISPQTHLTRSTSKGPLGLLVAFGLVLLGTAASGEHREGHRQVMDIFGERHPGLGQ